MLSIQKFSVVIGSCRMVLSITAFYIRIYLRNLRFHEFLVFFFYETVVKVFGLHLCEILMELECFFSIICPRKITHF